MGCARKQADIESSKNFANPAQTKKTTCRCKLPFLASPVEAYKTCRPNGLNSTFVMRNRPTPG
jgi:hypothetical protein